MSQPSAVAAPGTSAGARGKGFTAELDRLRDRMRGLGFSYDETAAAGEPGRLALVRGGSPQAEGSEAG